MSIVSWSKENRGKAIIVGILALALFAFVNYEIVHFSSTPGFCKGLCHTMTPDVDMWELSSHGRRGIDCVGCHFKEGLIGYMTNKVVAMNDLINTVTGNMASGIDVNEEITHHIQEDPKYRGMELAMLPQYVRSPELYPYMQISSKANEDGEWAIMMHRGSWLRGLIIENCVNCHSSKGNRGRFSPKKTADFIVRNQLLEFTGKIERRRKGIIVPHAIHLDKGYNCLDCHAELVHGAAELKDEDGVIIPSMEICFQCHNDRRAPRDCTLCHQLALRMNLGIEGIGVPDSPNYMYPDSAVCGDCHLKENEYKMLPSVCVTECHEEGYDDTMHEWQSQTTALLDKVGPQVKSLGRDIESAKNSGRNVGPVEELYNEANYNYSFVKDDGSKGAHNVDYAESLLGIAQEKLDMARDLLGY